MLQDLVGMLFVRCTVFGICSMSLCLLPCKRSVQFRRSMAWFRSPGDRFGVVLPSKVVLGNGFSGFHWGSVCLVKSHMFFFTQKRQHPGSYSKNPSKFQRTSRKHAENNQENGEFPSSVTPQEPHPNMNPIMAKQRPTATNSNCSKNIHKTHDHFSD